MELNNFKFKAIHNQTGEEIDLNQTPQSIDEGYYMISPDGQLYEVGVSQSELWMERVDARLIVIEKE